jgi:hypothetical protein
MPSTFLLITQRWTEIRVVTYDIKIFIIIYTNQVKS